MITRLALHTTGIALLLMLAVLSSPMAMGQSLGVNTAGFRMQCPANWFEMERSQVLANISKEHLTTQIVDSLLKVGNGESRILTCMKYNPKIHAGVIPTVRVALRPSFGDSITQMKPAITKFLTSLAQQFKEFTIIVAPTEATVAGRQAVMALFTFNIAAKSGETYKIRNRMYVIPNSNSAYQINLLDTESEDSTVEFDALLGSIVVE